MPGFIELTGKNDRASIAINIDIIKEVVGSDTGCDILTDITKKGASGFEVEESFGKVMQLIREEQKRCS